MPHVLPPSAAELFRSLGLTSREAAVLSLVASEGDTTAAAGAARLGFSRPQVSAALRGLEDRGLVERVGELRPQPVALAADVELALADLLREREQERQDAAGRVEEAAALLREAAQELARRPRPDLRRLVGGAADAEYLRGKVSVDEVSRPGGTSVQYGGHFSTISARKRLLVLGPVPSDRLELLHRRSVEVRTTEATLPVLAVVDCRRARVEIGTIGPARGAWTFDAAQVCALQRLFDLWWEESQAVL